MQLASGGYHGTSTFYRWQVGLLNLIVKHCVDTNQSVKLRRGIVPRWKCWQMKNTHLSECRLSSPHCWTLYVNFMQFASGGYHGTSTLYRWQVGLLNLIVKHCVDTNQNVKLRRGIVPRWKCWQMKNKLAKLFESLDASTLLNGFS